MCPACFATAALIAGGATSLGGLTVLVAKKLNTKTVAKKTATETKSKENDNGQ